MKMSKQLLTFLFMLAVSGSTLWAQRAGVNTTIPEATLDIQADPTSVTANEANGILIPRLTGDEIKAMTGMQASTLIYATAAATTPELTAEHITEPGYYYYNADDMVWVRVQTNTNDEDEWFTRNDTTFLRRSDEGQIPNRVFFDANGYFKNVTIDSLDGWNGSNVVTKFVNGNALIRESSKIAASSITGNKSLSSQYFVLDNSDTSTGTDNDRNHGSFNIVQNRDNNADYTRVRASTSQANLYGAGTMKYVVGANNAISVRQGSSINNPGYSIAGRNESYWNSTGTSNAVIGVQGRATIGTLAGNLTRVASVEGINTYLQNQSNEIEWSYAGDFRHAFNSGSYEIKNLIGVNIGSITSSNGNVENSYGLYVGDVTKGTNSRYSIYTNQGKSSLGDTLQVRNLITTTSTDDTDKVVVADADGVLKTKSAAAVSAASEPWYNKDTNMGATTNTDTIYTKGYVGIGTETPASNLHVMTPGAIQNNIVTVGDPTYNGDSALSFLDPGTNSAFETSGLNSSVRVFGKNTATGSNSFEQLGESKLSPGLLLLKKLFRGTDGIDYSGLNLMTSDGVVGFLDSRTVIGRYGGLPHYSPLFKNTFKISHEVDNEIKAIFSMDNEGDMHLINGEHTTTPTMSIMADKNVGINNPSPMADLDIKSNGDGVPALKVEKAENPDDAAGTSSHVAEIWNPAGNGRVLLLKTGGSSTLNDAYFVKGESNSGVEKFVIDASGKIKASNVIFTGIPTHADDAAAGAAGLVAGEMYKTATGELRIKL